MDKVPKVTLDTTLAELYAIDAAKSKPVRIFLCPYGLLTTITMGPGYPRNLQYPVQDFIVGNPNPDSVKDFMGQLFKVGYLSLVPQRDTFAAGAMDVFFVTFDEEEGKDPRCKIEVDITKNSVIPSQQIRPTFIPSPQAIAETLKGLDGDVTDTTMKTSYALALRSASPDVKGFDLTCDVDTHYFLNSKAAIVSSGLPTPKTTIVQLGPKGFDPTQCCEHCAADPESVPLPAACQGPRRTWINQQIARAVPQIKSRPLPFVLKTQQSFGGLATFIIQSEEDRTKVLERLETAMLPNMLSCLLPCNAHLNPASLMLSDYITDLAGNWGVTFFVTQGGKSIFLGASEQRLEGGTRWKGSTISYPDQDALKAKFTPLMEQIGAYVQSYGYYGPMGADILEAWSGENGKTTTEYFVVDLNVRFSGSLNIVLLRKHLSEQRGLHIATSMFAQADCDREGLIAKLPKEFEEGRITLTSWHYKTGMTDMAGAGTAIFAGEDHEALQKTIQDFFKVGRELDLD